MFYIASILRGMVAIPGTSAVLVKLRYLYDKLVQIINIDSHLWRIALPWKPSSMIKVVLADIKFFLDINHRHAF